VQAPRDTHDGRCGITPALISLGLVLFRIPSVCHATPFRVKGNARVIAFVGGDHAPAPIFSYDGYPIARQVDWSYLARISHGCGLAPGRGACLTSPSPDICARGQRKPQYSGGKKQGLRRALATHQATLGHARHRCHVPSVPLFAPPHGTREPSGPRRSTSNRRMAD
jgi:hypothetical protein